MFIDTEAANKRARPTVVVDQAESSNYRNREQDATPLLETFVGQEAPPPSYLEATTPMPWDGRPSGDEGSRLLAPERASFARMSPVQEEPGHWDGKYQRKGFRDQFTKRKMAWWIAMTLGIIVLLATIVAVANNGAKVCTTANVR